jgi:DNA-binding CsgD family transcriptional regulator
MTASRDDWDGCIDHLYDSVGLEDRLTDALSLFRPFFESSAVVFATTPDPRTQQSALLTGAVGLPTSAWVEYVSHFNVYDEWIKAALKRDLLRTEVLVRGSALIPQDELKRTYFWREWLARYNVGDIMSCIIEPLTADNPSSFVTFQRRGDQSAFSDADLIKLGTLAPHLRRALRLHRRLAPQLALGATLMQLFHATETPMLLIARDGALIDQNPAAQAAFSAKAPLISLRANQVQFRRDRRWHELASCLEPFETQALPAFEIALGSDELNEALLEVRRVHGAFSDRLALHAVAAVCTLRPGPQDFATAFRVRHGLTPTEWKVVDHLAKGLSPTQAADAMGVRLTTMRSHIRSVLVKTGTKRQGQLLARMLQERSASLNR